MKQQTNKKQQQKKRSTDFPHFTAKSTDMKIQFELVDGQVYLRAVVPDGLVLLLAIILLSVERWGAGGREKQTEMEGRLAGMKRNFR